MDEICQGHDDFQDVRQLPCSLISHVVTDLFLQFKKKLPPKFTGGEGSHFALLTLDDGDLWNLIPDELAHVQNLPEGADMPQLAGCHGSSVACKCGP